LIFYTFSQNGETFADIVPDGLEFHAGNPDDLFIAEAVHIVHFYYLTSFGGSDLIDGFVDLFGEFVVSVVIWWRSLFFFFQVFYIELESSLSFFVTVFTGVAHHGEEEVFNGEVWFEGVAHFPELEEYFLDNVLSFLGVAVATGYSGEEYPAAVFVKQFVEGGLLAFDKVFYQKYVIPYILHVNLRFYL